MIPRSPCRRVAVSPCLPFSASPRLPSSPRPSASHLFQLPFPALEQDRTGDRQQRERDRDRPENSVGAHSERVCEQVGRRDLEHPKDKEIQISRSPRVTCAIERRLKHHAEAVEGEAVRDDVKSARTVSKNLRLIS